MDNLKIEIIYGLEGFEKAKEIRYRVFVQEQSVPQELEWDSFDKIAHHLILYLNNIPIGTARLFTKENRSYIGRVAVLKEYRGKGYGRIIMKAIMEHAKNIGIKRIYLHSQTYIKDFYKKLGYKEIGDKFIEAGIPHVEMFIDL